jgi:hypothetical protein
MKYQNQIIESYQNKIQEKQQSFHICTNLIEDLTNQCNDLTLEKEQLKIDFHCIQQQIELNHNQYKNKLDEYFHASPNAGSNQEESDRLRFLFLSHFSNFHRIQETHDYFESTLDDENDFEEFFSNK